MTLLFGALGYLVGAWLGPAQADAGVLAALGLIVGWVVDLAVLNS